MADKKTHKSRIGKGLINMLMFQMYGDEKLIYREYVQNARDAINEAVDKGVLETITDGRISITINEQDKCIEIRDNGTGIALSRVESVLLDIADSDKDGETSAGQFGIGRLVGGYFCKTLSFKTSYKGEDCASEIVFNIDTIKTILNDDNNKCDATDVINEATSLNLYEEDIDEHYFIVTLSDIDPEYPSLLKKDVIAEYLKEVAPIDYSAHFKNQLIMTSVHDEYRELQRNVGYFQISVNGSPIEKRYGLKVVGTDDVINGLEYFSLKDETYGLLGWGWYALTDFTKAIPVSDPNSHFRLRKHNIQVGDFDMLSSYFPEKRGNKYFYGEIHIVNPRIKLNSARDGLAPTPEAESLKREIRDYFKKLHDLYYLANKAKNAVKQYEEAYNKITHADDGTDVEEAKDALVKAKKTLDSISKSKNVSYDPAARKVFDSYKQRLNGLESSSDNTPQNGEKTPIPHTKTDNEVKQEINPFDVLVGIYSEDNISLIRKVCDSYMRNCPVNNRKLIEELQRKVLKDLV